MLEVNVGRLRHHRSARLDTNIFGERACLYPEDFVAGFELGYVPAGSLDCSGVVRARAGVFWFAKSEEDSAGDAASQHPTVEKSEGDGANPDEKLVVAWNRLFHLFNSQNIVGRTVFAVADCFHGMCRRAGLLAALIRGGPIGELKPAEEDNDEYQRRPLKHALHLHNSRCDGSRDRIVARLVLCAPDQEPEYRKFPSPQDHGELANALGPRRQEK